MQFPKVQYEQVVFGGGLDLNTPTLALKPGFMRRGINFECMPTGGYGRVAGYERFDGHASPSGAVVFVLAVTITGTIAVGDTITGNTSAATAKVVEVGTDRILVIDSSGNWELGETIKVGGVSVGTLTTPVEFTSEEYATYKSIAADYRRTSIAAVPGSGSIRGVFLFNDVVYALRDTVAGTTKEMYKSTASGWSKVTFYYTVAFSNLSALVTDGMTLTKGGVTATVKRACIQTGAILGGVNTGVFVVSSPAGGSFSAGAATLNGGAITVTLGGAEAAITLAPGGRLESTTNDVRGGAATTSVYGADGVSKAWEFDGTVLVPITTGIGADTPKHVEVHRKYLFLSIGEVVVFSAPGAPYDFTVLNGAGAQPMGDSVTGLIIMPGSSTTSTMAVFTRSNTFVLYGSGASTWNWVTFNTGSGAMSYSPENMAQTLALEDRGVISLNATLNFGNFDQNSLTYNILPLINKKRALFTCAVLNRAKSQYRVFFSDGSAIFLTIVNGNMTGSAQVQYSHAVNCAYDAKMSTGEEVSFFGSTDGFVYQFEKGTSFDGGNIYGFFQPNFANMNSPRIRKRYRKVALEVQAAAWVDMSVGYILGYGSPDVQQPMYTDYGNDFSPAYWDEFTWDQFRWDGRDVYPLELQVTGTAENIACAFRSDSKIVESFIIDSAIIHYTFRRAMR